MTLRTNTAEGGTNGVAVSTGNSGGASGDAWTTVSAGAGGSITYTTAYAAQGTTSIELAPASGVLCYTVLNDGATGTGFSMRLYVYLTGYPSSEIIFAEVQGAAGGSVASIHMDATGKLRLANQAASVVHTMSTALALNTWHRVVLHGDVSASASVRYAYYPLHSTTPTEQATVSAVNTLNAATSAGRWIYGKFTGTGTMSAFRIDAVAQECQSNAEIGPIVVASSPQAVTAVSGGTQYGAAASHVAGLNDADDTTGTSLAIGESVVYTFGGALAVAGGEVTGCDLRLTGPASYTAGLWYDSAATSRAAADQSTTLAGAGPTTWRYQVTAGEEAALTTRTGLAVRVTRTA